jgi:small ligand-binding sensory domain FIST
MEVRAASVCIPGAYDEVVVREAAQRLRKELGIGATCAFVFASVDYGDHLADFIENLRLHGHIPEIFGCTGRGVIGSGVEQEEGSGFSILMLHLPETRLQIRSFGSVEMEMFHSSEDWKSWAGVEPEAVNTWLALINPLIINIEGWLSSWNKAYPGVPCLGGLASSSLRAEGISVFHNGQMVEGGLLIGLSGSTLCEPLVSQGCRPIGEPFTITQVNRNIVYQLGGKSAFDVLNTVITEMTDEERETAKGNVFVGLATSEYLEDYKQGDFLVRNILGADPESGGVVIGSLPRVGQTLQYQMRDRVSAIKEMEHLLEGREHQPKPVASLVFSCIGRGFSFFGRENYDASMLARYLGQHPSAGFFCNGEVGPVAGQNYVHGYTMTAGLFRTIEPEDPAR